MNTGKLKKLGNKIAMSAASKSPFGEFAKVDQNKLCKALLTQVKTLPKEEQDFVELYVSVKIDMARTETRMMIRDEVKNIDDKLDTIIDTQKDQGREIKEIKGELYTNGKE